MSLPKDQNFTRRGALPLFLLLLIGVVVAVGGTYIVREQFIKQGKSGKATYDEAKIKEQAKNPQPLPELKEEPRGELAVGPFVYKPKAVSGTTSAEPSFSIRPPAGWENLGGGPGYKVQFKSTEEDREDQEDGLYAAARPQISIGVGLAKGKSPEDFVTEAKSSIPAPFDKMTITVERKIKFAGEDAIHLETELVTKGMGVHAVDYYLVKNDYFVHIGGTALKEAWSKREPVISGSLATFRFL